MKRQKTGAELARSAGIRVPSRHAHPPTTRRHEQPPTPPGMPTRAADAPTPDAPTTSNAQRYCATCDQPRQCHKTPACPINYVEHTPCAPTTSTSLPTPRARIAAARLIGTKTIKAATLTHHATTPPTSTINAGKNPGTITLEAHTRTEPPKKLQPP